MSDGGRERVRWVDAARGSSMVLVTIFHTVFVVEGALGYGVGIWPQVDAVFLPLRMPLFFFVSGLLAAGAVHKPLRETRRRTLGMVYLYVLWSLLQLVHLLLSLRRTEDPLPEAYDLVANFFFPTGLWFFWALAAYFFISRLLVKRLGKQAWTATVPLFVLGAVAPLIDQSITGYVSTYFGDVFFGAVCQNFVWFYLALHIKAPVLRFVASATWGKALIAMAAFAVVYIPLKSLGIAHLAGWVLSPFALAAALLLLGLPSYRGPVGRALAAVGQRTLPIYATQWLAMHLLATVIVDHWVLQRLGDADVVASIATPVLALAIVAVTWWVGGMVLRSPLAWLFAAPAWLVGAPRSAGADLRPN